MQHIPTSSSAVSKLKKAAKLAARKDGITHAEALDQVAREASYLHWKHVTDCADRTLIGERELPTLTGLRFAERVGHAQSLTLVFGPTGAGKTIYAMDAALNALRDGLAVHVLDVGRSYLKLCQSVGGTLSTLLASGEVGDRVQHGSARLTVHELESALRIARNDAESLPTPKLAADLLIVDELWQVIKVYDVLALVRQQLERGGSALVVSTDPPTLSPAQELAVMQIPVTVRRNVVHFDSQRRMAFIGGDASAYRAFDGGKPFAFPVTNGEFRAQNQDGFAAHIESLGAPRPRRARRNTPSAGTAVDEAQQPTIEAVRALDGRHFATLSPHEQETYRFYRDRGRKYGVGVMLRLPESAATPLKGAQGNAEVERRGVIRVTVDPGAEDAWETRHGSLQEARTTLWRGTPEKEPKSLRDSLTAEEKAALDEWAAGQVGDPQRGGAIDLMAWPGWSRVMRRKVGGANSDGHESGGDQGGAVRTT